jgi:sterol desaturase/sphingolipid hydroxylase (fatty acid hydroxylase superfamily)
MASTTKPQMKGTERLFKNDLLERLSRTHVGVPIGIITLSGLLSISYGFVEGLAIWPVLVAGFLLGILAFTLMEYLTHRFFYHMEAKTEKQKELQYKFHGVHHDYPKDKTRLAMPPVVSTILAVVFFYLFTTTMLDWGYGFFAGFAIGYAGYLFVHYIVHAWRPPNNAFKVLWVHHGVHHYKRPDKAFGVSSPFWDVIFRTMP